MANFDRLHQLVSEQQSVIDDLRNNVQQLQRKQCEILSHIHFHTPSKSKDCPFKPVVNHNINCTIVNVHEELKSDHVGTRTQQLVCNNTVNNCQFLQQLQVQLQQYDKEGTVHHHNIQSVLDNFGHLMQKHNHGEDHLADEFHHIYDALGGCCDIKTCARFSRHQTYRDNHSKASNKTLQAIYDVDDDIEVTHKQIIDKIHCFYRHCYDIGNRVIPTGKTQIMASTKPMVDCHERHRKFTLLGEVCDEMKSHKTTRAQPMFSLGYKFEYDEGYCTYLVPRKYDSLKEELISNDVVMLTTEQFDNELRKSVLHFHSYFCKHWMKAHQTKCDQKKTENIESILHDLSRQMRLSRNDTFSTGVLSGIFPSTVRDNKQLQMHHILSLMVYCNFTHLQFVFSATYRKKTLNEPDESVLHRHSTFYHFGKYLKEAVQWFGSSAGGPGASNKLFYHGINDEFIFPKVLDVDIQCPLSTTTAFSVAVRFATESGVILALKSRAKYISVSWLSDYGNESEHLFLQSNTASCFNFENIILTQTGVELAPMLRCMRHMEKIVTTTRNAVVMTMQDQTLLQSLIENELHRKLGNGSKYKKCGRFPRYAANLFRQYCTKKERVCIDKVEMVSNMAFVSQYFMVDEYPKWDWTDLVVLRSLYPNIKYLRYSGSRECNIDLCKNTMANIHDHFEKMKSDKWYSKLTEIRIGTISTRGKLKCLDAYNSYKEWFRNVNVTLAKNRGNNGLTFKLSD
eukprot:411354_1